jgi:hypothetical protein
MIRTFFVFVVILFSVHAHAQFGGFPPSAKWKQINTDTARIIFTGEANAQAQRIAAILHRMAASENTLGGLQKKINIMLHNKTTLANGYVSLAPFRSEFYLVPGSNIFEFGNLPWNEQLVVHEYRHVIQFNNFNRGLSKVAGVVLGQEGRALANAIAIPDWFFEGDAVYAETVYTPQGRGRTPWFFNGFTSLWKEGRNYSWMKLRNGSLKDQVPNHYPLGYLLVNYGYLKYGADFWRKVTNDASAYKGLINPFQKAVKRYSGIRYKTFREDALSYYRHEVSRMRDDARKKETVSNYYFPQVIGKDSLLYLKESYKTLPAFYIRDKNGEHKLSLRNISAEDWISYRNGTIAYTMYNTNPRWSLVDYSDVVLYNIKTGKEEQITHKGKYFTPDLSPDGQQLVVVSMNDSLQSELQFLDLQGNLLKKRAGPAGAVFIQPRFIDSVSVIVGIRQPTAKISVHKLDLNTMKFEQVVMATRATSGFFHPAGDLIYFTSSLNGGDDIYVTRLSDRRSWQLTTGGVGHYFPSVNGNLLTWSEYTASGLRIMQKPLDSFQKTELLPAQWGNEQIAFPVAGSDSAQNVLDVAAAKFPVSDYKKSTGLFNFHSWRPYYEDPEFSFTVYSDNVLNNFSNSLFYRYNQNETSHTIGFNTAYAGLFPVLSAGVEKTFGRNVRILDPVTLNQFEARIGYYLPLDFTKGKTYKYLLQGTDFVYNETNPTGNFKDSFRSFRAQYFHPYISWTQQLPRARQHIYSRLGYTLTGHLRQRIDEKGRQVNASANFYLPGLFRNHSLVLNAATQITDTGNVLFSNHFAFSRGYPDYYYSKMQKLSANYHLPLLYPDKGIANIVYFLRVRANLFYDQTIAFTRTRSKRYEFNTVGSEIYFDTKWWNMLPVTFGFRYSRLLDGKKFGLGENVFEFVVPVNLIPQ